MDADVLRGRTKAFAIRVIRLVRSLPTGIAEVVLAKQLVRSATSIGSNYRAACRARSRAEFTAKMQIVQEEADETQYWLELLQSLEDAPSEELSSLRVESTELSAIFTASITTIRRNKEP
jgi:four helix bundle protein